MISFSPGTICYASLDSAINPPLVLAKEPGKVWWIKRKSWKVHVYDPEREWMASFHWSYQAKEYLNLIMKENDVIAYY